MSLGVPTAQFPARGSQQVVGGRSKVQLTPGHSLMDWIRLGRNTPDLAGTGGRLLEVTPDELNKHNKQGDAWMALRGRVYNVSPYMDFHPGGVDELMRGAGGDGTNLFDEIHKWVNFESMLEKCLVGKLIGNITPKKAVTSKRRPPVLKPNALAPPTPPQTPHSKQPPRYEWFQTENQVTIAVYTKWKLMKAEKVIIDRDKRDLKVSLMLEDHTFTINIRLEHEVEEGYNVNVMRPSGKVEVVMVKSKPGNSWTGIGRSLEDDKTFKLTKDTEVVYRCCHLESISEVSHDTYLYAVALPTGTWMSVPTGHHVHIKHTVEGMEVVRSYTVVRPALDSKLQDERLSNGQVFYLMIKIYPDGAFTPQLSKLHKGDSLEVSSHTGNFQDDILADLTHLVLYAAGTGFTPMVNLLYDTLIAKPQTNRKVHLSFFNKSSEDILWREQLEALATSFERFELRHILSRPGKEWTGLTGRVRQEVMDGSIPSPGEGRKVLFCACGPLPFTQEAIRLATSFGYSEDMVHAFLA